MYLLNCPFTNLELCAYPVGTEGAPSSKLEEGLSISPCSSASLDNVRGGFYTNLLIKYPAVFICTAKDCSTKLLQAEEP